MICPEDFFTPKSLETAFSKSLSVSFVRETVFASAQQTASSIQPNELDAVLKSSAKVFLHFFIKEHSHEARVFCQRSSTVQRIDDWALTVLRDELPTTLPLSEKLATTKDASLDSRYAFFDQELWVLDCERLSALPKLDATIERVAKLINGLDGCSLCFPVSIYPEDLGAAMNTFAKSMIDQKVENPPIKLRLGRPRKIDRASEALRRAFPDGFQNIPQKNLRRSVETELNETIGMTTLRKAMAQVA
ncbi:hypothetical protein [Halocynthiibacter namhaensis]|uniref:hypothetical protein n=1 Tax=Halocynthiibacter namhaensis TaxID=1290553 RepID=UPI000578F3DE|nr:hypothetical protein [Halocynthiibacter namhaensis]